MRAAVSVAATVWTVVNADGSRVTIARFPAGRCRYLLHAGSTDPGWAALHLGVRAGPAVTGSERSRLIAAFNGGFLLSTGVGGYEQEGHVIRALQPGLASLVIDTAGRAAVGVWGQDLPRPGEAVYSVRQNLPPLVRGGQPSPTAGLPGDWGATLGGGTSVARSGLGMDGAGNLLYAGSMDATPLELAQALANAGARTAMELDINPEWVQLALSNVPGGALYAGVPGQHRPAYQYVSGWTRDFVTVLAG